MFIVMSEGIFWDHMGPFCVGEQKFLSWKPRAFVACWLPNPQVEADGVHCCVLALWIPADMDS